MTPSQKNEAATECYLLSPIRQLPYEKERLLLSLLRKKDFPQIKERIDDLLSYTIFSEKEGLSRTKLCALEMACVLARLSIETGADNYIKQELFVIYPNLLQSASSFENLYRLQNEMAEFFMQYLHRLPRLSAGWTCVCQAKGFVHRNYPDRLTLSAASNYVNLNPSYFSSVFRRTNSIPFNTFVNQVRIAHSRQLLADTQQSVLDIAIAVGFEDQGYFTKTFRKYCGMTPGAYRKSIFSYHPS